MRPLQFVKWLFSPVSLEFGSNGSAQVAIRTMILVAPVIAFLAGKDILGILIDYSPSLLDTIFYAFIWLMLVVVGTLWGMLLTSFIYILMCLCKLLFYCKKAS